MNKIFFCIFLVLIIAACTDTGPEFGTQTANENNSISSTSSNMDVQIARLKELFSKANVVSGPDLVDCTLSDGADSTCFKITVTPSPSGYKPGPWCPRNVTDAADAGGIWFSDGDVYDVDGEFIKNLNMFYDDEYWQLIDSETGLIRVTDTKEKCAAAARPDVAEEFQNYCVECLPEYMSADASITYTIPITPVNANQNSPTNFTGSGIAINGIRLDGPAPVDAILGAHTIAPFDDCGGHVNLHVGYHYHAVTNCLSQNNEDEHGAVIGIAMDGYNIHEHLDENESASLDTCNGHETGNFGYHYHAGAAGSNAILGCLTAQYGCVSEDSAQMCNANERPKRLPR